MMGAHQHIGIAPSPAVMAILSRFDRPTLEAFLTVAVDLLDTLDPDSEAEPTTWPNDPAAVSVTNLPDDSEAVGDERDVAWIEWDRMAPVKRKHGNYAGSDNEDDEDDDPTGHCDEDGINTELRVLRQDYGPGCKISDTDYCTAGEG
jgi:hypothetical protein